MSEWVVVTVIIALAGLIITVTTPVVKLNKTITKLEMLLASMKETHERDRAELKEDLAVQKDRNSESHRRIYGRLDVHENKIEEHDKEIMLIKERTQKGN